MIHCAYHSQPSSQTGTIQKPRTKIYIKTKPSQAEINRLESELLTEFNESLRILVSLYSLAERWEIHNLMNRTIDAIQDGYLEFGTVFGPGLAAQIWQETKLDSILREFCIASTVMHMGKYNPLCLTCVPCTKSFCSFHCIISIYAITDSLPM